MEYKEIVLPDGTTGRENDRGKLWNDIEAHHKRKDAIVAREIEIALPAELTPEHRRELALEFVREIVEKYGVGADVAIHAPDKNGDQRNHHAHILLTGCHVSLDGTLGKKANELDPIHCQRAGIPNVTAWGRERWGELANTALEKAGREERIDHRTLKAQGIEREPGIHFGPGAIGYERRTGEKSRRRENYEDEINARLQVASRIGELERHLAEESLNRSIEQAAKAGQEGRTQRRGPRLELDEGDKWRGEKARFEAERAREKAWEQKLEAKEREEEEEEERRKQEQRNRLFVPAEKEEKEERSYLDVPPGMEDLARQAGAQYDNSRGQWYLPIVSPLLSLDAEGLKQAWRKEVEKEGREIWAEARGKITQLEGWREKAIAEHEAEKPAEPEGFWGRRRKEEAYIKGLERWEEKLAILRGEGKRKTGIDREIEKWREKIETETLRKEAIARAKKANPALALMRELSEKQQREREKEIKNQMEGPKKPPPSRPKGKGRGFW